MGFDVKGARRSVAPDNQMLVQVPNHKSPVHHALLTCRMRPAPHALPDLEFRYIQQHIRSSYSEYITARLRINIVHYGSTSTASRWPQR
jgi:hypothetical protein